MAFDGGRSEFHALEDLEEVLGLVADELASWRGRALKAEQELKVLAERVAGDGETGSSLVSRLAALEEENRDLHRRVEAAKARVGELLRRLTFVEQQSLEETGERA